MREDVKREAVMGLRIGLLIASVLSLVSCGRGSTPVVTPPATVMPTVVATAIEAVSPTLEETSTSVPASMVESTPTTVVPAPATTPIEGFSTETTAFLHDYLYGLIYAPGTPPRQYTPGAVLLVDTPAGRFAESGGVASLADGTPLHLDDRFEIGSITKLFTAAALLRLHEESVLALDDPVAKWLPEQAAQFPFGAEMTLRQLAGHTAGLGDYERDLYPMPQILNDPATLERGYAPSEITAWVAANKQPLFPPGASGQWMYSNTGYILLGMALEAATGQSLAEIYAEYIFTPLGMESAILLDGIPGDEEIVRGYNAMLGDYVDVSRWNASGAWAAGALAMNAADLARFGNALVSGELFADEATLNEMTRFISTGQQRGFADYGLGLSRLEAGVWGHGGGTPGFGTLLLLLPEEGVTAIYLGNNGAFNINPNEFLDVITRTAALSP